jgi:hypothetical protein
MYKRNLLLFAGPGILLSLAAVYAGTPPAGPAYQIVLRSRQAEVTPMSSKDSQTGGGSIVVEEPEPNTVVVTMGGSAVVGSDFHGSVAGIDFNLEQDLDIIPTRKEVRPPRVGLIARVVGTLQVTEPCKCFGKPCGSAEQGSATACLVLGTHNLLSVNVKGSSATCGQAVAVNNRDGPVEAVTAVGSYRLTGSFHIGATQGKGVFHRQYAVADFDPAPQLDAFWADALKPFRAVPRRDFGFKVVLRVVEEPAPCAGWSCATNRARSHFID